MRWLIHRTMLVAISLLLFYTAPLCLLASDGRENPYAAVVSFRLELIFVLAGIMAAWWTVFVVNARFRRR